MLVSLSCQPNKSILEQLRALGISVTAVCGGNGRCGKCAIRVVEGNVNPGKHDEKVFGQAGVSDGWRLACGAYASGKIKIEIPENCGAVIAGATGNNPENAPEDGKICIVADIGTTTVVCASVNKDGNIIKTSAFLNPQAVFGADVLTRIRAYCDGKADALTRAIRDELARAIGELVRCSGNTCEDSGAESIKPADVRAIIIAGNTAMLHLLMGYDCNGLREYPFKPFSLEREKRDAGEILGTEFAGTEMLVLPGVGAFIGADIVSGIFGLELDRTKKPKLLVDLGTNGETVYAENGKLFAAGAAAGPAFEGGQLSCGMGCVAGAVKSVRFEPVNQPEHHSFGNAGTEETSDGQIVKTTPCGIVKMTVGTVGGCEPRGICGSGVLELLAGLRNCGIIDEFGTLSDPYFETGFTFAGTETGEELTLTQKDIREVQLAKGAVRAVAEMILKEAGKTPESVAKEAAAGKNGTMCCCKPEILLAGGFGTGLDVNLIKNLGIFPENDIIKNVGNSCLSGLKKVAAGILCGTAAACEDRLNHIAHSVKVITVAGEPEFQELFIKHMNFE